MPHADSPPKLLRSLITRLLRPGVIGVLRHLWRAAGVRRREVGLSLALAFLVSVAEGVSLAFLIPLSDAVAAGSFGVLEHSRRFGWVTRLVPSTLLTGSHRDVALALALLSLLLLARFLKVALEFLRGWWQTARDRRYFTAVARETFQRVASFGSLYFRRRPLAHIDTEISWSGCSIQVLSALEGLFMHVLRLAIKVAVVLAISTHLFLFMLASLAVLAVLTHLVSRRAVALADFGAVVQKATRRETMDTLAHMPMVKALRQEATVQKSYQERTVIGERIRADIRRIRYFKFGLVEITVIVGVLLGEGLILVFVPGSPLQQLARFCAFFLVAQQCLPDLQEISASLLDLVDHAPRLEALARIFDDDAKFVVPSGPRAFAGLRNGIALENVSFEYEPAVPVLKDLYAWVPAGQITAVVGGTGSGKTTTAYLLARLFDCEPHTIRFDGQDIREFALDSFRRRTFLVSQEPWILDRSLRDNLCFGLDDAPAEEALWQALRDVELADYAASLPGGLDTELGDDGALLSGGQRQLLALARVLLRDLDLLVLDEATSALDSALEERVMAAIRRHLSGRTVVVIAHRFSTVRAADHVLVLESGSIAEAGPWQELVATGGVFSRLFEGQLDGQLPWSPQQRVHTGIKPS